MDKSLADELKEAEAAVAEAEKKLGPDHPDLADKLQRYAALLRQTEKRVLDAVNVEARARAIRAKMYAEDEKQHGSTTTMPAGKVKVTKTLPIGMYLGVGGIFIALASLVMNQHLLIVLLPIAILLAIVDVAINRTGFWRPALVLVFCGTAWLSNQSLPPNLMTEESPIARYNYANQDPELVENARNLDKPTPVLSYSICLPKGFAQVADTKEQWGRTLTFQGEAGQDLQGPKLSLMLMRLPEGESKGKASLLKTARDVALPQLGQALRVSDLIQENPVAIEINGLDYAKINFSGQSDQKLMRTGFAYVTIINKNVLVVSGDDQTTSAAESLPKLDASIYTFHKLKNGDDLEMATTAGDEQPAAEQPAAEQPAPDNTAR
jgi:hypothetical protein